MTEVETLRRRVAELEDTLRERDRCVADLRAERDRLQFKVEERDAQVEALNTWRTRILTAGQRIGQKNDGYDVHPDVHCYVACLQAERDAARAQLEALQHKFDVATTGPVMFPEEANRLRMQVQRLREALEFYADPGTYFAIAFIGDAPHGDFLDDFEEDTEFGSKPGKRARAALTATEEP